MVPCLVWKHRETAGRGPSSRSYDVGVTDARIGASPVSGQQGREDVCYARADWVVGLLPSRWLGTYTHRLVQLTSAPFTRCPRVWAVTKARDETARPGRCWAGSVETAPFRPSRKHRSVRHPVGVRRARNGPIQGRSHTCKCAQSANRHDLKSEAYLARSGGACWVHFRAM